MPERGARRRTQSLGRMSTEISQGLGDVPPGVDRRHGCPLTAAVTESGDVYRIDLQGERGELLLSQRGEPLKAVQHIVSTAFRKQLGEEGRVLVDCQHFRRDKDNELQQMARFLASKALRTGAPQEIGPLNAYSDASSISRSPRKAPAPKASATPR